MTTRYILVDGVPKAEPDTWTWGKWMQQPDNKRIAFSECKHHVVSTVFLGLDHSFDGGIPILFESMVFTKKAWYGAATLPDQDQRRYTTRAEASVGHEELVKEWQDKLPQGEQDGV